MADETVKESGMSCLDAAPVSEVTAELALSPEFAHLDGGDITHATD